MTPDDFRRLVAAGLTSEQIAVVMEIIERDAKAVEAAEEERKSKGRERWHRWKEKQGSNTDLTLANVSQRLPTLANDLRAGDARVDDITSNLEILPQEEVSSLRSDRPTPKRASPSKASRLAEDWSLPHEWRQDALDAGLASERIDAEAAKIRDWSRSAKNGAKLDWRAAWRNWCREAASRLPARPPPRQRGNGMVGLIDQLLTTSNNGSPSHGGPTIDAEPNSTPARQLPHRRG